MSSRVSSNPVAQLDLISKLHFAWQSFSALPFAVCLTTGIAILVINIVTYRRYFHPLSRIPGPFWASVTSLWLLYHDRTLRRHALDSKLHEKYGPIVRIAPDNVMLSSPDVVRIIYSPKGDYNKSEYYEPLGPDWPTEDRMSLLTETNMDRYRLIRRVTGPLLNTPAVSQYESLCNPVLERFVSKMTKDQGKPFNVSKWAHMVSIELLESMVFSESDDILSSGDDGGDYESLLDFWQKKYWLGHFRLYYNVQRLLRWYMPKIGLKPPKEATMDDMQCFKTFTRRIKARTESLADQSTRDFFADVVEHQKGRPAFRKTWIPLMAYQVLGAGFDSMGSTITATINLVARDRNCQERLHRELDDAKRTGRLTQPIPTLDECLAMPYLQATANEAMRLHTSVGTVLERVVPSGGATFEGFFLPAGSKVGCNPWVLHRNEDVYGTDAHLFNPDRFLLASPEDKRRMDSTSLRWGGGMRRCPGEKMAWVAISKYLATLFAEFDVELLDAEDLKREGLRDLEEELTIGITKWYGTWMRLSRRS